MKRISLLWRPARSERHAPRCTLGLYAASAAAFFLACSAPLLSVVLESLLLPDEIAVVLAVSSVLLPPSLPLEVGSDEVLPPLGVEEDIDKEAGR